MTTTGEFDATGLLRVFINRSNGRDQNMAGENDEADVSGDGDRDCEGPATATSAAAVTTTAAMATTSSTHASGSHMGGETHAAGASESLPPSPTASVGCVAHGDHW